MLYQDETVRLVREVPDVPVPLHAEGTVARVLRTEDSEIIGAEVRFHTASGTITPTVPLDAMEPVLSGVHHRTAVFWGLQKLPAAFIESTMHVMLDKEFALRDGLNVARLNYVQEERWWKWGDRLSDPTGAQVVSSAPLWDGAVVAFSGPQRFQLQFRLTGRREPVVLLHERDEVYNEQAQRTAAAMSLTRLLLNLLEAAEARYCAFPVAGAWLTDEDWPSLLRAPHYPDFFLLPEAAMPGDLESEFRSVKMTGNRVMATVLPVKFSPGDPPIERTHRELMLDSLRKCFALGEKYYDQMYETHLGLTGLYASAKDAFYDAISIANELGLKEESQRLSDRLDHIKNVFRSQFS